MPSAVVKTQNNFTWAQDGVGNSYIATTLTTLDPGQSYQAQKQTTQTVDNYGNVLQVQNYDYNSLSTPLRTYTYTWLHTNSSTYTSLYILNRMTGASVTDNAHNTTGLAVGCLRSVRWYQWVHDRSRLRVTLVLPRPARRGDGTVFCQYWRHCSWQRLRDINSIRRDLHRATMSPAIRSARSRWACLTQVTSSSSNNLAVPSQLTVGSLTTNLTWSTFLGLTNETGPNGDSSGTYHDQYARPSEHFGLRSTNIDFLQQSALQQLRRRPSPAPSTGAGRGRPWTDLAARSSPRAAMPLAPRARLRASTDRAPVRPWAS